MGNAATALRPCTKCGSDTERYPSGGCKPCDNARRATPEYRARRATPEARARRATPEAQAKVNARRATPEARVRRATPEYRTARWAGRLWKNYELTPEAWARMLTDQAGCCAVCDSPMIGPQEPHVDHCRETTLVRGLLCLVCNVMVGNHKPERLERAMEYVEQARERHIESLI